MLVAIAAGLSACAVVPPGILIARPEFIDRIQVEAPPPGWKRLAVVPFGGDPAHRRPAEELVAVTLVRYVPFAVLGPFPLRRHLGDGPASGLLAEAGSWAHALADPSGAEISRDRLRRLALDSGADALVLGWLAPGGASAELVLVDAGSGAPVAALRRTGSASAAERGVHELAMSSTQEALIDLVEVLRTPPGARPKVRPPRKPHEPQAGEVP